MHDPTRRVETMMMNSSREFTVHSSWEDRYVLIVPVRSAGGQRLYTRDRVEELRSVRDHIQSGLQPADAHRLLAERRRSNPTDPASGVLDNRDDQVRDAPLTILLAERDPYAAEFAEYFLRTEGYLAQGLSRDVHHLRDSADAVDAGAVLVSLHTDDRDLLAHHCPACRNEFPSAVALHYLSTSGRSSIFALHY